MVFLNSTRYFFHKLLHGFTRLLHGSLLMLLLVCAAVPTGADVGVPELPNVVNVNTADAHTIARVLKGVGLTRANEIVAYRERHGMFEQLEHLTNVKGVGERTLRLNEQRIRLQD